MKEYMLRDIIAQNIGKLKLGLTLLQKEQYIPNTHGTKSFIDLYATDNEGHHILIELKRSDAAARQAIHEVNKYVESVKQHLGVKDNEIHVIIASTEWGELLVPFSRFSADTSFSIEGIKISITNNDTDFIAESVERIPISEGRFISPWHNVHWYSDRAALERGVVSIEAAYKEKGIDDFLVVKMYAENQPSVNELQTAFHHAVSQMSEINYSDLTELPEIPVHKFIAYTALQVLEKEKCLEILAKREDSLEEVLELLPDMDEDEALCYLHESVEALDPRPEDDCYEIGYPAKFEKYIGVNNFKICEIVRHGIFLRNSLLSDETLISELRGEDGSTGQKFKKTVNMQNHAHVELLKKNVYTSLIDNPVWRNHILRIIEEIQVEFPDAEIEISIFNPCTGVFTIYYAISKEYGPLYIPTYYIIVRNPNEARMYFGALQESGLSLSFPEILHNYYDGNLESLLIATTWGGKDFRDSDIIENLGAQYRSFRCDTNGDNRIFFTLRDEKWRSCEPINPLTLFEEYLEKNIKLVHQISTKIQPLDMGGFFNINSSILTLDEIADLESAKSKNLYFAGAPDECDLCSCSFNGEKYMIDGEIKGKGSWACMCADCFQVFGERIGWGYGQLYIKDDIGWLLVGGSFKDSETEEI